MAKEETGFAWNNPLDGVIAERRYLIAVPNPPLLRNEDDGERTYVNVSDIDAGPGGIGFSWIVNGKPGSVIALQHRGELHMVFPSKCIAFTISARESIIGIADDMSAPAGLSPAECHGLCSCAAWLIAEAGIIPGPWRASFNEE